MFKITKDAIYLFIIFWLILIMAVEFHRFVAHYEYLTSILKLMHKFTEPNNLPDSTLDLVFRVAMRMFK